MSEKVRRKMEREGGGSEKVEKENGEREREREGGTRIREQL